MHTPVLTRSLAAVLIFQLAVMAEVIPTTPLGTAFTYQGQLKQNGLAVSDPARPMRFSLFTAEEAGHQVGSVVEPVGGVRVVNGLFSVTLDFDAGAFDGTARWLEIAVVEDGNWVVLTPRQVITPTPYALYAREGNWPWQRTAGDDLFYALGNVGIGPVMPQYPLHVEGNSSAVFARAGQPAGVAVRAAGQAHGLHATAEEADGIGVQGTADGTSGTGVYGLAGSKAGTTYAVKGTANSPAGYAGYFEGRGYFSGFLGVGESNPAWPLHIQSSAGVGGYINSTGTSSTGIVVMGQQRAVEAAAYDPDGQVVYAASQAISGDSVGVYAESNSPAGCGVHAVAKATTGGAHGGRFISKAATGAGVFAESESANGLSYGVFSRALSTQGRGVHGEAAAASGLTYGVSGSSASETPNSAGVFGKTTAVSGNTYGVLGNSVSSSGPLSAGVLGEGRIGVRGQGTLTGLFGGASLPSGTAVGGDAYDTSSSPNRGGNFIARGGAGSIGVRGEATGGTGEVVGVHGTVASTSGVGVHGQATSASGGIGVKGEVASNSGYAAYFLGRGYFSGNVGFGIEAPLFPVHVENSNAYLGVNVKLTRTDVQTYGGRFETMSSNGAGVYGVDSSASGTSYGGRFESASSNGVGVFGRAITTSGNTIGVYGASSSSDGQGVSGYVSGASARAVAGRNPAGTALYAEGGGGGTSGPAIRAISTNSNNGIAIYASNNSNDCTFVATNTGSGQIIKAYGGSTGGDLAFEVANNGNTYVRGNLSKGGGSFKIDHPLDPQNKYLSHSFVESPDMMNVYNGNVTLDHNGEAVVFLPEYFESLNGDFRYQLTAIGGPAPNLHVAAKISGNRFRIAGGAAGLEVSWQVTGVRQDLYALANPIVVEAEKDDADRGRYLHPEARGLPSELGIGCRPEPAGNGE